MTPPHDQASTPPSSDPSDPWTHHWRHTLSGSIDLQADDPVAAALRAYWSSQLPRLRHARAVADVGSGPAILARLMPRLGWTLDQTPVWWCVDQAHLGSAWRAALPPAIRVLDATDFCASQPPQGPVDAVVSNFGMEYLPLPALASALSRWLRPEGTLSAVVHARDSIVDRVSRAHEADLRLALDETHLHDLAAALVQALATAPEDPMQRMMHGVDVRDAYNAAVDRLKDTMEQRGQPSPVLMDMLQGATQSIRMVRSHGLQAALDALQSQRQAYEAERARLQQMQASALDPQAAQAWLAVLQTVCPRLRLSAVSTPIGGIGWNFQVPD